MSYDLLIKNGRIYDGSGTDSYGGSIGVKAGHIVAVGEVDGQATHTIDADGLAVTPGFVDVHTHYDAQVSPAWSWATAAWPLPRASPNTATR